MKLESNQPFSVNSRALYQLSYSRYFLSIINSFIYIVNFYLPLSGNGGSRTLFERLSKSPIALAAFPFLSLISANIFHSSEREGIAPSPNKFQACGIPWTSSHPSERMGFAPILLSFPSWHASLASFLLELLGFAPRTLPL